ncbi:MAG: DoxX family protein [Cyclobacteriaceae bacterium]|nr:DoxX family protein [Cyclobacteriaceae bacterium]
MKNFQPVFYWGARLVAAIIMLQTLYFKFSGSEESVYIFSMIGMEPWGRIGVGVFELIASVLLLIPSGVWLGAILAIGLMVGAIGMHLTILGIEVMDDGGQLFIYAVVVTLCSCYAFWLSRSSIPEIIKAKFPLFLQQGKERV